MKTWYYLPLLMLVMLTSCANNAIAEDPVPVHETFTIASEQLGETRTINVWTPPQYATDTAALPVLYMPDGGIKEDFPHIANTLAALVNAGKIPPIILVGIENTQRRKDLTGPTTVETDQEIAPLVGGSEAFRAFVEQELFPEIDKRYRTTREKGIIGESLAGLFVLETLMLRPQLFDYYIAFDPSLWWNDKYLVKTADTWFKELPSNQQKKLWFASSGARDISGVTKDLAKTLKTENLAHIQWTYIPRPKEKHHTIFRATKEEALIWTLNEQ